MPGYRQEVFNVLLAQLLQERGAISAPEKIIKHPLGRKMPDVIVTFRGLRTAIEGEVNDNPQARDKAIASARKRVEDGVAHIGVAVVYPQELRDEDFSGLKENLAACSLEFAIVIESEDTGFVTGNVDNLESALRHAFEHLVQEDIVTQAVKILDAGIEQFAGAIVDKKGIVERLAETLGIRELPERLPVEEDEE
jgi:hypothetical protein